MEASSRSPITAFKGNPVAMGKICTRTCRRLLEWMALVGISLFAAQVLQLYFPETWKFGLLPEGSTRVLIILTLVIIYRRCQLTRQRELRNAFSSYLAPQLVEQVMQTGTPLRCNGETRDVSVLFTDITGFTHLTEQVGPDQLVTLLNDYINEACSVVQQHGGTIDKIVGDALHVIFNYPSDQQNHAQMATECALALDDWSQRFRQKQMRVGLNLGATRIGVNSGECLVGSFGGNHHFDYTVHGDVVNTAARLETLNKQLGTRVCVSEATAQRCERISFRALGKYVLSGKSEPITVLQPVASINPAQ